MSSVSELVFEVVISIEASPGNKDDSSNGIKTKSLSIFLSIFRALIDESKLTDAVLVAILLTVVVTVVAVAKVPPEIEIEEVEVETELTLVPLAWALPVIEISALDCIEIRVIKHSRKLLILSL